MTGAAPQRERKAALRRELRSRRRAIDTARAQDCARCCADALAASRLWRHSAHIGLYWPSDGELDPTPLARRARRAGRRLYLPRIAGGGLEFADWNAGQPLLYNRYGIGEPTGPARALHQLDLLLLPLVGWTRDGDRLGMGAGFYDRTLGGAARRPVLVGLAYACQEVATLPRDDWDVQLDAVLTERGLQCCRGGG